MADAANDLEVKSPVRMVLSVYAADGRGGWADYDIRPEELALPFEDFAKRAFEPMFAAAVNYLNEKDEEPDAPGS